jgi:hypothetical protein
VKEVVRLDAKRFHWKAEIAGQDVEWDTEITEQAADQRLVWTSRGGDIKAWVVTFHPLSNAKSKVMLQLEYDPQGLAEQGGDALDRCLRGSREIWNDSKHSSKSVGTRQVATQSSIIFPCSRLRSNLRLQSVPAFS